MGLASESQAFVFSSRHGDIAAVSAPFTPGPKESSQELKAILNSPHPRLKPSQYLILALVAVCAPLGDSFLARGMRVQPSISFDHPLAAISGLVAAVFTPWIAAGIGLLICFFACYLTALSWADLTYVLPTTAFGYVIIALLGRFWLHEQISPLRWAGILLITLGVGFAARGPSRTEPQPRLDPAQLESPSEAASR